MAIIIDQVRTHEATGTGDDTVPPGIPDLDWCHVVSTTSALELETFLTVNILTIGVAAANIRTPLLGSRCTYVGLGAAAHNAAVAAGAVPNRLPYVAQHSFDHAAEAPWYEP